MENHRKPVSARTYPLTPTLRRRRRSPTLPFGSIIGQCRTPSFNDVFGSNVDSAEVDFDVSYFGISLGGQNVVEQASQSTKGSKK